MEVLEGFRIDKVQLAAHSHDCIAGLCICFLCRLSFSVPFHPKATTLFRAVSARLAF